MAEGWAEVPGGIAAIYDPSNTVLLCGSEKCCDKAAWEHGASGVPLRYSWPAWLRRTRLGTWLDMKLNPDDFLLDDDTPHISS